MDAVLVLDRISERAPEEWLAARKLGSSDIPTILGINPYKTPYALYLEKLDEQRGIFRDTSAHVEAAYWGRRLEPLIADEVARRTGCKVWAPDSLYAHPQCPFLTATPDRFIEDRGEVGTLELKSTSFLRRGDWEGDSIPDFAHVQLLHQLAVLSHSFGYVAGLIGGQRMPEPRRIERDDIVVAQILDAASEFWRCVETQTPPPLCEGDLETLRQQYPEVNEVTVVLPAEAADLMRRYLELGELRKGLDKERAHIQALLLDQLGSAECGLTEQYMATRAKRHRAAYTVAANDYIELRVKEVKRHGKK